MVSMEMTYKDVIDFVKPNLVANKLELSTFSTINQEVLILDLDELGRMVSIMRRHGRI